MIAGSFNSILLAFLYNAMISQYVILCTHQVLFVVHVMIHSQSPAVFVVWRTHSIHVAILKPTFCNVFPHIEKSGIGMRAERIYAEVHFNGGISW